MSFQIPNLPEGVSGSQTGSSSSGTSVKGSLATTAKVAVIRLPEQVMQLSPMSGSGLTRDMYLKVPEKFTLSATAQYSLARVTGFPANQAALLETATKTQTLSVNSAIQAQLHEIIAKALSADEQFLGVKFKATATQVTANQLSVRLEVPGKPVIDLPLPSKGLITPGDTVTLSLKPVAKNLWSVQINLGDTGTTAGITRINGEHKLTGQAVLQQLKQGITLQGQAAADLVGKLSIPGPSAGNVTAASMSLVSGQLKLTQAITATLGKIVIPKAIQLPQLQQTLASLKAPLLEAATDTTVANHGKLPALDPAKGKQVQDLIVQLSRQLLADTGSTRQALQQLVQALNHPNIPLSASSQALMKMIHSKIDLGMPNTEPAGQQQGANTNSELGTRSSSIQGIQALFSSLAQPLTPATLMTPQSPSNFLSGLVTLLQVTLAGRAIRQQPALAKAADDPASFLSKTMAATTGGTPSRVSQEFARLDAQSQIVSQIKTLLANHQQQKLINADSRIQGQDNLYFVLPVNQEKQAPPEVLVRREEREQSPEKESAQTTRQWHLTMKLDIDDLGQMLVKSRVTAETLDLNIYTSTDPLLAKVADTLPLLLKRLSALGLTVESSSFQRGKIPENLAEKPYQLFEARV